MYLCVDNIQVLDCAYTHMTDIVVYETDMILTEEQSYALTTIDLSHNVLNTFPGGLMRNCHHAEILYLGSNQIGQLLSDDLSGFPRLKYLDLSENMLQYIGRDALLPSLHYIDISSNALTSLPQPVSSEDRARNDVTIDIDDNPWICNCLTYWMIRQIGRQAETNEGPFDVYGLHTASCTTDVAEFVRVSMLSVARDPYFSDQLFSDCDY